MNLYSIISKYHLQSPGFTHFCASFEGWLRHEDLSWICLKWPGWSLYTPGWSLYTGAGPKVNAQILDKSDWELGASIPGERWVEESCPNVSSKSLHRTKKTEASFYEPRDCSAQTSPEIKPHPGSTRSCNGFAASPKR